MTVFAAGIAIFETFDRLQGDLSLHRIDGYGKNQRIEKDLLFRHIKASKMPP